MKKMLVLLIFIPLLAWSNEYSKNELLIQLSQSANPQDTLGSIGAKSFESLDLLSENDKDFFKGPLVVRFDDSIDIQLKLKTLLNNPMIKSAQLNYKYTIQGEFSPNDPLLKNQWEHQNQNIQKVWNETTDCRKKIVAVLDTGVNFTHIDLKDSAFNKSYNAINPSETPIDYNGHGTLMASIIGARGDNYKGVSGICWATQIMAIKVLNDLGEGFSSEIIKGLTFAKINNASILNLSFGSYSGEDFLFKAYLEKSISKGAIAIVPAGNNGLDMKKKSFWPCSFKLKGMLCVASTSKDGNLADFSNFGENNVELAAPGENIYGIAPGLFKEIPDNFNDGWIISDNSKISVKENCISNGKNIMMIPQDYCGQEDLEKRFYWGKKDFGSLLLKYDFSYVQFSAKSKGKIKFLINQVEIQEISNEESEYFLDLNICKGKNVCLMEFITEGPQSKVALYDFKIWGLKLGNTTYQRKYGSSLSAAYVTALAALIGTYNPKFSNQEIIDSLIKGSKYSKNLNGKIEGSRAVDPWGQLKFLSKPKWN